MAKRIWIVNHYAEPPDGMATRPIDMARRIVESGHQVTIFASNFVHNRWVFVVPMGPWLWRTQHIDGVRLVWVRTPPYKASDWRRVVNMVVFSLLVVPAALFRRERPNVVIGVTTHPFAALVGWMIASVTRARFFFEVTDLWPQTLIEFGRIREGSVAAKAMRWLERFLYDRAERIVMMWRDTATYVESVGADRRKIVWIPHGVELERYRDVTPYDGKLGSEFRVVFLGSFVQANAIGTMVDAGEQLALRGRSDIVLELVGSGVEKRHWQSVVWNRRLRNVRFPEPVPKDAISSVMSRAHAFVYGLQDIPLYRFGITLNKLPDYLAAARPVVFYGTSSYDPVREARAGFSVPPNDPGALATALEGLADLSPAERVAMGQRGYQFLCANHLIKDLVRRYLDLF